MKKKMMILTVAAVSILSLFLPGCVKRGNSIPSLEPGTVVAEHGGLQTIGNQLCDQKGNPIQLKGIALMDVSWFKEYANEDCLKWLRDDWDISVYRAVVYVEEDGNFAGARKIEDAKKAVDAAIAAGLYVIIDWHVLRDEDPMKYKDEAAAFFKEMAETYKGVPNVIYEICSEPNGKEVKWATNVKPYAEEIIPVIRRIDKKALILVGTPTWSQDIDRAADDPLRFDNVMYVLHFYAGTHGEGLRDKIDYILGKGYPVIVTEWGVSRADGGGGIFHYQSYWWIDYLNERNISWIAWSISSRDETSAALKTSADSHGGWDDGDLSDSGLFVRALTRGESRSVFFAEGFETENFRAGYWERENTGISRTVTHAGAVAARFVKESSLARVFSTKTYKNGRLSFWYKTENYGAEDSFRAEWYDGRNWNLLSEPGPSEDWKEISVDLPKEADDNIRFQFRFRSSLNEGSYVYLDDIRLELERM